MIRILIPVYNEEKNIKNCVIGIHKSLSNYPHIFYLVNDGSHDKSLDIINSLKKYINIVVLNHNENKGVAEAFKTGLKKIFTDSKKNDILAVTEGDGTSTPELLSILVKEIELGADIAIASRYIGEGKYVNFPRKRLFLSRAANLIMQTVFPYNRLRDYTIFFRAYDIRIIKKVFLKYGDNLIKTKFFTANAELLVKCIKFNPVIVEVPYVYDYGKKKGSSGLKIAKNVIQYFRLIYEHSFLRQSKQHIN